ncbi:hypothetical protein AbraIFM66950_003980 [Aspergillus brasiliensis]|nr:hypothetical protein AbraIFM66950_003980 [Aspergillus brasiliensis]
MGSTSTAWEVSSFEVQTTTPSATSDGLYANDNMQVPVVVVIKAIDSDSAMPYELSESDLETIKLADYDDPPTELSGAWSYSTTENEKRYWVTTTKIENKKVAASIKQPNGTVVHTAGASFESKVTLTGTNVVTYKLSDLNLRKGDTTTGSGENIIYLGDWSQTNYYLTAGKYLLRKADFDGYNLGRTWEYKIVPWNMLQLYSPRGSRNPMSSIYWPMGPKETRRAGRGTANVEITVNEEENALCFTYLHVELLDWIWFNDDYVGEGRSTFYDQFGNPGTFWVGYKDDHTTPEILDHKYDPDDDDGGDDDDDDDAELFCIHVGCEARWS